MARIGRPPKGAPPPEPEELNFYGLRKLGYAQAIELTGDYTRDQLAIEMVCYRIGHTLDEGGLDKFGHYKRIVDLLWNNPELRSSKRHIWSSWGERMLSTACEGWAEVGVAGCASAGKSDPFALYGVVNYIADPTHTLVLILSTTIAGAKKRIWKSLKEYWSAIPDFPGRALWSTNEIRGLNYEGVAYGDSSGIFLMASEQSGEREATERLQGIKAPRTGEPDESLEALKEHPEFEDLAQHFDDDTLKELLPRLLNLCEDRIGKLILIVDEATGCAESILTVCRTNFALGNVGHFQVIMLGNPKSYYDTFGQFCQPKNGWKSVTKEDMEWETAGGGICIRFNAEENPRIVEKNDKYSWMPRAEDIKRLAQTYGTGSLFYHQMVLGFWCPEGSDTGIYRQSEIEMSAAMEDKVTWGYEKPKRLSSLDPSFSSGGDRASATFGLLGKDITGKHVLLRTEEIPIQIDLTDKDTPPSFQIVKKWKEECVRRGVPAHHASFDVTGGGITFGDVVRVVWSPNVRGVAFGGKATKDPVGNEKNPDGTPVLGSDRYANRMSQIWCGAHPFFRTGQLKGITVSLAKELCSRRYQDKGSPSEARLIKVEDKRLFKAREGKSPDESDSYLIMVDDAKARHGFKPDEEAAVEVLPEGQQPKGSWALLREKARGILRNRVQKKSLRR